MPLSPHTPTHIWVLVLAAKSLKLCMWTFHGTGSEGGRNPKSGQLRGLLPRGWPGLRPALRGMSQRWASLGLGQAAEGRPTALGSPKVSQRQMLESEHSAEQRATMSTAVCSQMPLSWLLTRKFTVRKAIVLTKMCVSKCLHKTNGRARKQQRVGSPECGRLFRSTVSRGLVYSRFDCFELALTVVVAAPHSLWRREMQVRGQTSLVVVAPTYSQCTSCRPLN